MRGKDWLHLLRKDEIREWYQFSRGRIHMKYFFDSEATCWKDRGISWIVIGKCHKDSQSPTLFTADGSNMVQQDPGRAADVLKKHTEDTPKFSGIFLEWTFYTRKETRNCVCASLLDFYECWWCWVNNVMWVALNGKFASQVSWAWDLRRLCL